MKIIKNATRPRRWLSCSPSHEKRRYGTEISAVRAQVFGSRRPPRTPYSCLSKPRTTFAALRYVDFVEDQFLAADGLVEGLLDGPPRGQELHLLLVILHEEVLLELGGVQELLDEALSVVLSDHVFDPRVFDQVDADPQHPHLHISCYYKLSA